MTIIKFKTKCPYKIGDKIQFKKGGQVREMKITDIIAERSVATGRNNIVLELDGWYKLDTKLHEIKTT
ncbi:MAG: hypothetical protein SPE47_03110 [Roseburia faecis]|jgi:hypothetical protein|nr:hypothetical protein [Roseburia faecis]